jgi:hypothetical protein
LGSSGVNSRYTTYQLTEMHVMKLAEESIHISQKRIICYDAVAVSEANLTSPNSSMENFHSHSYSINLWLMIISSDKKGNYV